MVTGKDAPTHQMRFRVPSNFFVMITGFFGTWQIVAIAGICRFGVVGGIHADWVSKCRGGRSLRCRVGSGYFEGLPTRLKLFFYSHAAFCIILRIFRIFGQNPDWLIAAEQTGSLQNY